MNYVYSLSILNGIPFVNSILWSYPHIIKRPYRALYYLEPHLTYGPSDSGTGARPLFVYFGDLIVPLGELIFYLGVS